MRAAKTRLRKRAKNEIVEEEPPSSMAPPAQTHSTQDNALYNAFVNILIRYEPVRSRLEFWLDSASYTALSLTCKALYYLHRGRVSPLFQGSRLHLLTLIEKDIADKWYLCHVCSKLHRTSRLGFPKSGINTGRAMCRTGQRLLRPCGVWKDRLTFQQARCAMIRHLYGGDNGWSVALLEWGDKATRSNPRPTSAIPRIIHGELYYCITSTFNYAVRDWVSVQQAAFDFINYFENRRLCPHMSVRLDKISCKLCVDDDIKTYEQPEGPVAIADVPFACVDKWQGSCPICLTDFEASVELNDTMVLKKSQFIITVKSYYQLGPCQSPDDWKWTTLTRRSADYLVKRNKKIYPPGSVRQIWQLS
ncbi:hypothetical protein GGR57DRAFT_499306 [Xylariaceae sp. FL1272]|nr:hypothetical protein GGR57DRAFT_499306 [Xylariaceae sp. FL1272]